MTLMTPKEAGTDEVFRKVRESVSGAKILNEQKRLAGFQREMQTAEAELEVLLVQRGERGKVDAIVLAARKLVFSGTVSTVVDTSVDDSKIKALRIQVRVLKQAIDLQKQEVSRAKNACRRENREALTKAYEVRVKRVARALREFSDALAAEQDFRMRAVDEELVAFHPMWYPQAEDHRVDEQYSTAQGWLSEAGEHDGVSA
jgi:hypothetical protein